MKRLYAELSRRNVFRVAIAYLAIAWLILQIADVILDTIEAPTWAMQLCLLLLVVGFPIAVLFAWVFELTPDGIKREEDVDRGQSITVATGRRIDRVIIVVLAVSVAILLVDRFAPSREDGTNLVPTSAAETGQRIAVLPFVALSGGSDDDYLADGLTEEILNALAQLPDLLVTARSSSFYFKGKNAEVSEIANHLGVEYIVEGTIRRSEDRVRATAQLIRAEDGFQLWSDSFDRSELGDFGVQTEIAEQIATALDIYLDDELRGLMRSVGIRNTRAFVAYQKGVELFEYAHSADGQLSSLEQANEYFEEAYFHVPDFFDAYKLHTDHLTHQLIDHAAGLGEPDEELNQIYESLKEELETLVKVARNPVERVNAEYDQALLSGEWHRLYSLASQMVSADGCSLPGWPNTIALPYGLSSIAAARYQTFQVCDPLRHEGWIWGIEANIWSNSPENGIDIGLTGLEHTNHERIRRQLVEAYVAAGDIEQARLLVDVGPFREHVAHELRILLAASQGDREQALALIETFPRKIGADRDLIFSAWLGDREKANAVAARVDKHPFGFMLLANHVMRSCYCGAPFDLDAAPNLAKRVRAAELQWPPVTTIEYPLKTW